MAAEGEDMTMNRDNAEALIRRYYDAFNVGDTDAMLALVSDDVEHRPNESEPRIGRDKFAEFNGHMSDSYGERLEDMTIFASPDGHRGAAEFTVHGTYRDTAPGLPEAKGQTYILPAGSFFQMADGRITRITTFYNLADWVRQVS